MQYNKLNIQHTSNLFSTIQIIFNHDTFQTLSICVSLDLLAIRDEHLDHELGSSTHMICKSW